MAPYIVSEFENVKTAVIFQIAKSLPFVYLHVDRHSQTFYVKTLV